MTVLTPYVCLHSFYINNNFVITLRCFYEYTNSKQITRMDQELQVHPLAVFSMIDSYERKIGTLSSIGILLGNVTSTHGMRVIEVRASYPINYQAKDELDVSVNWPLADNWCELHKLTYPNDSIIGWFLAGKKLPAYSTIIHRYCLTNYGSSSIMTFLDLSFETEIIEFKAFRYVRIL